MNIANFFQKSRMIAKVEKVQSSKQRCLNLEDFDLVQFPEIIFKCNSIQNLILQRNQISELPKEFGIFLKGLKYLSIQFNNLQRFPECLKHLTSLASLNISHNPIKNLIEDIDCFKDLKYLWCNSCELSVLPNAIGKLTRLETFGARNNKINVLPDSIVNLCELRWLSLEDNNLHLLPNDINKWNNLRHLNLNINCFTTIPKALTEVKSLMYLHLQRNIITLLEEDSISALVHVKIILVHNPIENGIEFKNYKNLLLNLPTYITDSTDEIEQTTDSSEWDSDWAQSTDTAYLNYGSSSQSSDDEVYEVAVKIPKLSKFFTSY